MGDCDAGSKHTVMGRTLSGRTVLLTGHTGFKGGWIALWLHSLGARVVGVALPAASPDGIFHAARLEGIVDHRIADIRDPEGFGRAVAGVSPDLLIHMAAQPLVRASFDDPVGTFQTNAVGTAVVLDAARRMPSLEATIVVTSDKCYENGGAPWGFRESDPMGGDDPYSASKGCTELVAASFRRSFPELRRLATVRAGNVIGGGDWSADRLVPDIARAAASGEPVTIRNPGHVRPWQHVLEPLEGYLMLAERLLGEDGERWAEAWNFGPGPEGAVDVGTLAALACAAWGADAPSLLLDARSEGPRESESLRLDTGKARQRLGWSARMALPEAVSLTADWYRAQARGDDMRAYSLEQIECHARGAAMLREAA